MLFSKDDPTTWGGFHPTSIIAHDVARSLDRSTAIVGGPSNFKPTYVGITEFNELPQGLYGSPLADEIVKIDARQAHNSIILVDLSNDPTYGEILYRQFGPRLVGVQITRSGDGSQAHMRATAGGAFPVYNVGRTELFDRLRNDVGDKTVRLVPGPEAKRAYAQLVQLGVELHDTGKVYNCPPGQHDDLAIACAMLNWYARHPHLPDMVKRIAQDRSRPKQSDDYNFQSFV
jgi:hypothetical protein